VAIKIIELDKIKGKV